MFRAVALIACLAASSAAPPRQDRQAPSPPQEWVAFSADVRINIPNRPEAWGRYVQDEHGCVRQEMVHPDGSALITMTNFQTERMYRLYHGAWTSQPMHMGTTPRRPYQLPVGRKTDSIEGFDVYISETSVRSPRGDYKQEATVIPALNYFRAIMTTPSGERRTAVNIHLGPQPHDQFAPPPGAIVTEEPGFGGYMSFSAVVLRIGFAGQTPIDAVTTEETPYAVKTPSGIPLTIVTSVVDREKALVRIRVLQNASGPRGNVRGDLLDDVQVALGATGHTTRIGEALTLTVTRVGGLTK
ncbi:MAG TPA: hypothetical protein VL225_05280 [Vicinamibacterales bacterium]|jgi:hypothetical protein|nr:hypothetical protein [Vicinamibacterales bacterium]